MTSSIAPGDFTGLAQDYSLSRPGYSLSVRDGLVGLLEKRTQELDVVDVGAGTGIWTRMLSDLNPATVRAVEPNGDMRKVGIEDSVGTTIQWIEGNAEQTTLPDDSADWVTMASSFHWADFDAATAEFHRILRSGGRFSALWNPRLIEVNPLLLEIEAKLTDLNPDITRVSSGRSGLTETLSERLWSSPLFDDVVYLEGRHAISMTPERYIGAWRSVNDVRVQLGSNKFNEFISFVEGRLSQVNVIDAVYLTRAWSARRKS